MQRAVPGASLETFMSKRMLIDASHPEETRVVILSGNRVEEFDFESASRKPLKGNIYLAKVTRVEPSLQAAFVEYGGNRHGFLAFSEIHPDYYQIPVADRQALLAAQRADERSRDHDDDAPATITSSGSGAPSFPEEDIARGEDDPMPILASAPEDDAELASGFETMPAAASEAEQAQFDAPTAPQAFQEPASGDAETPAETASPVEPAHQAAPVLTAEAVIEAASPGQDAMGRPEGEPVEASAPEAPPENGNDENGGGVEEIVTEPVEAETISSGEDDSDEVEERRPSYHRMMRNYKIQEVIKKRQILLIQVVKEERGNKGAALTTYLSLAGRYCVLMPNSGRGGGISRKITNSADRRRLKDAAESLDVPDGMGLIVRTAGASRTKQEIQRDYEYLLRLWDSIRELTLRSTAPALVYEEGNLIKRAIRDQFSRDIDEIVVEGQDGYDEALTFTKMIMPAQAEAVKQHDGRPPLFQKYRVESQLDSMFNPRVQLKSGGYIIINQTEALVAIDVNSGRSTREHNIEDTATKTNLEAAEEIARQLRLRDLAGLIVIDFIDMEENRNDRAVERRLKDCLRHDRARIQIGRISPFGLLEMSRQRLRPGMVEGSTVACPHCNGTGLIRSVESLALRALRNVEEEAQQSQAEGVTVRLPTEVAVYIFNYKRADIAAMEERLGITIFVEAKAEMFGADCEVELGTQGGFRPRRASSSSAVSAETALSMMPEPDYDESADEPGEGNVEEVEDAEASGGERRERRDRDERGGRRGGRRRGRNRDRDERRPARLEVPAAAPAATDDDPMPAIAPEAGEEAAATEADVGDAADGAALHEGSRDGGDRRRRRRGRRGGRRTGRPEGGFAPGAENAEASAEGEDAAEDVTGQEEAPSDYEAPAFPPEPIIANEPPPPSASRPQRKSAAAAIARFFGLGNKAETEAEISTAAQPAVQPAPPEIAVEPIAAAEPAPEPERRTSRRLGIARPPEEPVADAPQATLAAVPAEPSIAAEVRPPEPEPEVDAVRPADIAPPAAPEDQPEVAMAPPADEPDAPRPIVVPEVEKSEIVATGEVAGPPKGGWWKKRGD